MTERVSLDMSHETADAIRAFAQATGVPDGPQQVAKVIQDALRVYNWVLQHQAKHGHIVVLSEADLYALKCGGFLLTGEREMLDNFVAAVQPTAEDAGAGAA